MTFPLTLINWSKICSRCDHFRNYCFYWTKTRLLFAGTLTSTITLRVSARGRAIGWPDSSACLQSREQVELTQPGEAPKATQQDPRSHSDVPKPPHALCLLRLMCAQRGTYLILSSIVVTNALWLSENTSTGCWHTALTSGYLSLSLSYVSHSWSLKFIPLIVSEPRRPHVPHLSPVESTVKCYVSSGRAFTEAWRPHTAPRDLEMRVNKPSEPSLTPRVVTYGTDWWENKAGSSVINASTSLGILCHMWQI